MTRQGNQRQPSKKYVVTKVGSIEHDASIHKREYFSDGTYLHLMSANPYPKWLWHHCNNDHGAREVCKKPSTTIADAKNDFYTTHPEYDGTAAQ